MTDADTTPLACLECGRDIAHTAHLETALGTGPEVALCIDHPPSVFRKHGGAPTAEASFTDYADMRGE